MSKLKKRKKPLKAMKIIPDELSEFHKLKRTRITEYVPKWRYDEEHGTSDTDSILYEDKFTDIEDTEENPFDLSEVEIISTSVKQDTKPKTERFNDSIEEEDFDPRPLTAQNMIDKFKRGK